MENHEYWQGASRKFLVQRFERQASQTQDCIMGQTAEAKRKIAEFVRICSGTASILFLQQRSFGSLATFDPFL